jgi:hypothetical protein
VREQEVPHLLEIYSGIAQQKVYWDVDKMPSLLRKVVIFPAVGGLILQSSGNGLRYNTNSESPSIRIDYKTNRISSFSGPAFDPNEKKESVGLETYGLVGK